MKHLVLAFGLFAFAHTASAGSFDPPVVQEDTVIQETTESSGDDNWVIAVMTFLVIVLGLAS